MIYFDSSALVKRYLKEDGTDMVRGILEKSPIIATSKLAYPEMISAFARKYKAGDLSKDKMDQAVGRFEEDWKYLLIIEIQDELLPIMKKTIKKYFLKGADGIHLSSAFWLQHTLKEEIIFVASDIHLLKAAQAEKLKIINPQEK